MASGLSHSLKNLNKAKNMLKQEEENSKQINSLVLDINNKNTIGASFTVNKDIYLKIESLANQYKSTKTDIVEALLKQIYDSETESLLIDIEKKEKIQRKPINIRLNEKYDKALKKISKETTKSYGEILTEILSKIE